jgi:o-succinylbenzoate synthase
LGSHEGCPYGRVMIIDNAHIYRWRLPFRQPLSMLGQTLTHREGLLLELTSGDKCGWGEIAPFPGLSSETIRDVIDFFRRNLPLLQGRFFQADDWRSLLQQVKKLNFPYPSVQFGVDTAMLHLFAEQHAQPLAGLFGCAGRKYILSNGLVTGTSPENLLETVQRLLGEGFNTLKIKVGRFSVEQEIELVRAIRHTASNAVQLRLDANRAWTLKEALRFAKGIDHAQIEYIEEPVNRLQDLEEFCRRTLLPVALDESLLEAMHLPHRLKIAAFILKPGIHGGVAGIIRLMSEAEQCGALPVLSSPFLSAFGLRMAVLLAAFTPPDAVMGLDASSVLEKDFLCSPLVFQNGKSAIAELEQKLFLDPSLMQRVM